MLKKVSVRNFCGIVFQEITLPPKGVSIEGGNAQGKTSLLHAIKVGLLNLGATGSMVRHGADASELEFVIEGTDETGDITVRRRMTPDGGNTISVKDSFKTKIAKPQTFLNEILGVAPIDALALCSELKPKERRERILSAVQFVIPETDVRAWAGADDISSLVKTKKPDGSPDLDRHGAIVIDEITTAYYDRRTIANRAASDAAKLAADAQTAMREKESAFRQKALAANMTGAEAERLDLASVEQLLSVATQEHAALTERAKLAQSAAQQQTSTSQRIDALRAQLEELQGKVWHVQFEAEERAAGKAHDDACAAHEAAEQAVVAARRALAEAEERERIARSTRSETFAKTQEWVKRREEMRRNEQEARSISERINELQGILLSTSPVAPKPEELQEVDVRIVSLRAQVGLAREAVELRKTRGAYDETQSAAFRANQEAERLDAIVRRWQREIPAEAFTRYGGIPGLSFGDDVELDGVPIGQLSGRERLAFCIEIARRGNSRSKFIVQDGLEAVDSDTLPFFLSQATRDGYQLIVTRVTSGALNIVPIDEFLARELGTAGALNDIFTEEKPAA